MKPKVIHHFLTVNQVFNDTDKTKLALVDIESIETISEVKCTYNNAEYRRISLASGEWITVTNSMEEIINTLKDYENIY